MRGQLIAADRASGNKQQIEAYFTEPGFAVANVSGLCGADKDRAPNEPIREEPTQN
jgi:hypothetical protein